jgi:hypothetical protein
MDDVKPRVGFIPSSEPLPPSAPGKNFFKVELLLGDLKKPMLPFAQKSISDVLSEDYYIATPGIPFSIRVKLKHPRSEGLLYGGRVYIDSGDTENYVFNVLTGNQEQVNAGNEVVTEKAKSKSDHFFWIGPGETEYTIEGFFKDSQKSSQFVFGEPLRKKAKADINVVSEVLASVGKIRIAFSNVEKFESANHRSVAAPKGKSVNTLLDRKTLLVAQPGEVVVDKAAGGRSNEQAVLENEVIFEKRIMYNSYAGYKTTDRVLLNKYLYNVDFYKGMPLNLLLQPDVRSIGIMTFLRNVGNSRFHNFCTVQLGQGGSPAGTDIQTVGFARADDNANTYVRVEDVVHFICESLSCAASFIFCTGREKNGNYGEEIVQRQGYMKYERLADYSLKERGLINYFKSEPGIYDIELDSIDLSRDLKDESSEDPNNENYKVRLCVVELLDDSDDEVEDSFDEV